MLIDWFTVGAQVVNFLILVWLLKRFLYRPILDAMDARQRRVRECVEAAEREKAGAVHERDEWEKRNAAFEQEKVTLLVQARQSAGDEKARLVEAARAEAESLRTKWRDGLAGERTIFRRELARHAQEEVVGIARRALHDLAGAGLEERIAQAFIERIEKLDDAERRQLATANGNGAAIVRSSGPLPPDARGRIESAVGAAFRVQAPIQFETNDALVGGIELSLGGHKIAWSLRDYLSTLEGSASELIDEQRGAVHEDAG